MTKQKRQQGAARIIFLNGKRLYLRPPARLDVPNLVRWFNDPEVTRFLNRRLPMYEITEEKWIERLAQDTSNLVFVIVLKGEKPRQDRAIGTIGLHSIDRENSVATTGTAIGEKDCWDKGYGTEAKMLLLDFAFNTLNLRKIYSHVIATNKRSQAYSEKCGYTLEATVPKHHFRDGSYRDELILAVYVDAWRTLWEKTRKIFMPA